MSRRRLLGMTIDELREVATEFGMAPFAAKQLADWIYKKRVQSIDEMTNLSLALRTRLTEHFIVGAEAPSESTESVDGTIKYLFQTHGGKFVETVYIPTNERATLCVSSQVGCKMNCLFCMTGKQGFGGNLTSNEIMNQIQSVPENEELTNLVFMGMGEPLDNFDELLKVIRILTEKWGYAWSPKRITVSSIGLLPGLKRLLDETDVQVAISLHATNSAERLEIMPVEKAYPMKAVLELLSKYDFAHQRRLSFEYIAFEGVNDTPKHAEELVRLLKGADCRVNLIRFHAIPDVELKSSSNQTMEQFRDYLNARGVTCTIRSSRGEDILAACGMLSTEKNKE